MEELNKMEELDAMTWRSQEIQILYDEYLQDTEGRGISYGEIAYLNSLDEDELEDLRKEIEQEQELKGDK